MGLGVRRRRTGTAYTVNIYGIHYTYIRYRYTVYIAGTVRTAFHPPQPLPRVFSCAVHPSFRPLCCIVPFSSSPRPYKGRGSYNTRRQAALNPTHTYTGHSAVRRTDARAGSALLALPVPPGTLLHCLLLFFLPLNTEGGSAAVCLLRGAALFRMLLTAPNGEREACGSGHPFCARLCGILCLLVRPKSPSHLPILGSVRGIGCPADPFPPISI